MHSGGLTQVESVRSSPGDAAISHPSVRFQLNYGERSKQCGTALASPAEIAVTAFSTERSR